MFIYMTAWLCYKCTYVFEHGGDTLGSIGTGKHCPRQPAGARGVYMVKTRRHKYRSIFAWRLFLAKEIFRMSLPLKLSGRVMFSRLQYQLIEMWKGTWWTQDIYISNSFLHQSDMLNNYQVREYFAKILKNVQ